MKVHKQLRWGGLWIIISSIIMNGMNIVVYLGYHNATIQAIYAVGFTGLVMACTIIHLVQARKSGILGLLAFLISVISLVYANVVTFLILEELAGIAEARTTFLAIWNPIMHLAVYGIFIGFTLLGISVAQAGVFPRWSGLLLAVGAALQLPAQYAMEIPGPLFFLFTIGGSILTGLGLIWMGWALWSGKGWNQEDPGLSNLDRGWGAPLVILTGFLLAVDAAVNMFGGLSLTSGITHLASYTALILVSFLLYSGHGKNAGWAGFAGFILTQLGATLYLISAYLIVAQLAGVIDNNRMLMASWEDIPIGRVGSYMSILGIFLLGVEGIRAETFPRASGWLIVAGIALALPFAFTIQAYFLGIFWVIGAILEGIGISWMGWTLLKKRVTVQAAQLNESTV